MATVTSLTAARINELLAGWEGVAADQEATNALISGMNLTLEEVQADLTLLTGTTMPELVADLAAGSILIADLNDNTIPTLIARLDANDADLENLNTVLLPALNTELDSNSANIVTLNDTVLPDLETRLAAAEDAISTGGGGFDPTYLETALADLNAKFPIGTTDIADDAITADKILAHTITALEILADTITANEIAADTITANEIAADAITASEIAAHTITAAEIFADTITANEIATDTITANEIATDTITANEIAADTITANEIAADTITANEIAADAITADEIAANTITANELSADVITVELLTANNILADALQVTDVSAVTFTGGTYKTLGDVGADGSTTAGVIFDQMGIRAYGPGGLPFMNVDPAAGLAIVAGTGQFKTLVVADPSGTTAGGASLGGITEIQRGSDGSPGKVKLTAGTTAPKNAPTVIPVWTQEQLQVPPSNAPAWNLFRGFAKVTVTSGGASAQIPAGDYFVSVAPSMEYQNQQEIHYWKVSDRTWKWKMYLSEVVSLNRYLGTPHGLTVNPNSNEIYVLFKDPTDNWRIWRGTSVGNPQGFYNYDNGDPDSNRVHGIGWDQDPATQTIPLIIMAYRKSDNKLAGHRTSPTGGSETAFETDILLPSNGSASCAGVLYGLPTGSSPNAGFDMGLHRAMVVTDRGSGDFKVTTYVGVHQATYDWPAGMTAKTGFLWDGVHFKGLDQSGKIWTYTTQWSTTYNDMIKWVSYTLANATYETDQSPKALTIMPKRSSLQISVGSINSGGGGSAVPDRVKFYVGRGATEPARTSMDKQGTQLVPGFTQITYGDSLISDGSSVYGDPPASNGFVGVGGSTTQLLEATNNGPFYVDGNSNGDLGTGTFRDKVINAARPPGVIDMYAGNGTIPTGWLACDGSSQLRSAYPALAAALGNPVGGGSTGPWGAADSTHFNLPDLRSRFPIGAGTFAPLGETDTAAESARTTQHQHNISTQAAHSHGSSGLTNSDKTMQDAQNTATGGANAGRITGIAGNITHTHNISGSTADSGGHAHGGATGNVVGGADDVVPYAGLQFIIKT